MPSEELRKRLEALNGGPLAPRPAPQADCGERAVAAVQALPPEPFACIEALAAECAEWAADIQRALPAACSAPLVMAHARRRRPVPPESLLFLDIETLGLRGEPVFLVGMLQMREGALRCTQLLARTLREEPAILAECGRWLDRAALLVSFNGRAYDIPTVALRAGQHGIPLRTHRGHLDVLHHARTRWRGRVPNCRLQTLESVICGRSREDDVPGYRIPEVYQECLRSGRMEPLEGVLRHNRLDLLTTAELLLRLCAGEPD